MFQVDELMWRIVWVLSMKPAAFDDVDERARIMRYWRMAYPLVRFEFYEWGASDPITVHWIRCKRPVELAGRYMRFVNWSMGQPGGVDLVWSRVKVYDDYRNKLLKILSWRSVKEVED